ncbi:MAG: acetolactate synthase small subunit [SAR324 cluster bacterium]|nr:acetolactate synthase small subunit [SAR324 cluster bacterium]MED5404300.1 acetolactate synthase small subunit [SAR324 cluster bacterium]MED5435087.1 acetolactate synthase small subunit [SAR324 cluster bacterium]
MEEKFAISIYVCNKPGVLVRLTQTFARRGYNIDSLVVSPAHNTAFSRITVVVQGEPSTYDQILRQLNKLVDVVHAASHESADVVDREMALFKVKVDPKKRAEIFQIVEVFRAKTVDITDQSLVIETTGDSSKIDALEKLLSPMGLSEMVRSGKLIMKRGIEET